MYKSSTSNVCIDRNNPSQNEGTVKSIIDLLVQEKEPMPLKAIYQRLYRNLASEQQLYKLLCSYPSNFQINDDGLKCVKLVTDLSICKMHCTKGKVCPRTKPHCSGLHICKFYILTGTCSFKSHCIFGHDLKSEHNNNVLKAHLLDDLNDVDIKFLLQKTENRCGVTVPKICKFYNVKAGCKFSAERKACRNLHICKHYVLDSCNFGPRCKRNHDILKLDVKEILKSHGIDVNRTPDEILTDLKQSYNAEDDESGSTTSDCSNNQYELVDDMAVMHLDDARLKSAVNIRSPEPSAFGGNQSRCRNMGRSPSVASEMGTPPGNRPRNGSIGAHVARSAQGRGAAQRELAMDQTTTDIICLHYLQGKCCFGQSCRNVHCSMPFQWRYKKAQAESWETVDHAENEKIELSYCDPKYQEYDLPLKDTSLKINFKTMTGICADEQMHDVKRLSTLSSFVSNRPLATQWLWYWKMETGKWKEYGDIDRGYKATLTSSELEQAYLSRPEGQMLFATQRHEYVLDFTKMCQQNLKYKTQKEVCRRPVFVTEQEVAIKKKQHSSDQNQRNGAVGNALNNPSIIEAPTHWIKEPNTDLMDHYSLIKLIEKHPVLGKEYTEIKQIFTESLPQAQILSIERIENGDLWMSYVSKRTRMLKKNNNKPVQVRQLFHGTDPQHVTPICKQGFDFRLSGKSSGTRYGKGSYFATTSKYSNNFTDNSDRTIFVVKVLVGDYTTGDETYTRPPRKNKDDPCSDLYDSCVDNVINPKIFVIYDNNGQVYPEYCIKYKL